MGFPERQTVGSLLDFLTEELKLGRVTRDTPVYTEIYLLSHEESILKEHEDKLGYHVPDESPYDIVNFRTGVWECNNVSQHSVAFTCYVKPHYRGKDNEITESVKTLQRHM